MDLFCVALGLLAALLLSFVSSGMETAMYRVSRVRMRIRRDRGDLRAEAVLREHDTMDKMVTTILIDNNIAAYLATYFVTLQLTAWNAPRKEIVSAALVTPLFFVLTESLPKQLAYLNADAWALSLVQAFTLFRRVLSPAVWLFNRMSGALRRLFRSGGEADISRSRREMVMEHFSAGVGENLLSEEQRHMAGRIMELEATSATDSMVPLSRLLLLPGNIARNVAAARITARRTRWALLTDPAGRPDGRVVTMAGLTLHPGGPDEPAAAASESLHRIAAGAAIPEVLNHFRSRHARGALVTDRAGRIIGLITTQGVLDKIAGITR